MTWREALRPLLPLFGLDVVTAFTVGMVPPLLPTLAAEWQLSTVEVGLINTVYAVGRLGGTYPATRLRAARGTRTTIVLGLAVLITGSLLCGLLPSFGGFLVGRLLMGIGASAAFLAVLAELLESAPPAWRGRIVNGFEAMAILTLGIGSVLGSALAPRVGWRGVFLGAAALLALGFLAGHPIGPMAGRHSVTARPGRDRAGSLGARRLTPVYVASLTLSLTWSGLFTTLVPLLGHARYGVSDTRLGVALGAAYAAELVGLIGIGLVIDRVRREPVFLAGAVSVAVGGVILGASTHPGLFVLGLGFLGAGFAVWMIPPTVLADRIGGPIPPMHLTVYRTAMDVGMIAGPLVLGGLAQATSDRLVVGTAGLVLIAGALALARR